MKAGKTAALLLGVILLGVLGWVALAPKKEEAAKAPPAPGGTQAMEGIRLEGGGKEGHWVITAERGQADATGDVGALTDVRFTHGAGTAATTGRAARAERTKPGEPYKFAGGVVIERGEWTAETPTATYDPLKGLIGGDGEITLASPEITVTGTGFLVDINASEAKIHSRSRARVAPGKGRGK